MTEIQFLLYVNITCHVIANIASILCVQCWPGIRRTHLLRCSTQSQTSSPRRAAGDPELLGSQLFTTWRRTCWRNYPRVMFHMRCVCLFVMVWLSTFRINWNLNSSMPFLCVQVKDRLRTMGAMSPMNIFLRQEVDRMQRIISVVSASLTDLKLAIDGTIIMSEVRSLTPFIAHLENTCALKKNPTVNI